MEGIPCNWGSMRLNDLTLFLFNHKEHKVNAQRSQRLNNQ